MGPQRSEAALGARIAYGGFWSVNFDPTTNFCVCAN